MKSDNNNANEKLRQARHLFLNRTRREQAILQILIDSISDEVWFCDADANLIMANKAAFKGLGMERQKDILRPMSDWLSQLEIYNADGQPRAPQDSPMQQSLEGKTLVDFKEVIRNPGTGELRHRLVNSAPIRSGDGHIVGALAVVRDITEQWHMEEARRRSDALLKQTQALAKVGGWEVDLITGHGIWTDEAYRIYGVARGDIDPGDIVRCMSFYRPEAIPVLKAAFDRAVNQGDPYDLELEFTRADGQRIWVRTIGIPETRDGKVVRIHGNIMDITERKQAESDMVAYKNIVSSTDDFISFVDTDYNYRVVNDAYLRLNNKKREDIVGHPVSDIIGKTVFNEIAKKELDRCFSGEIVTYSLWFDYAGVGRRFMAVTYSPYVENGHVAGAIVNGKDITDLKRTQNKLEMAYAELSVREGIAHKFLTVEKDRVYNDVLDILLKEFASEYGYIGYLNDDGNLVCPSMTGDIWEQCRMSDKQIVFPRSCWAGLWGRSLEEKRTIIANHGLNPPVGHIPVKNALAVPILVNDVLLGQFMFANKAAGYRRKDAEKLERIAAFIAPILKARLEKEKNQFALKETAQQLERQNIALNVLLDNREREKKKLVDDLVDNVERLVLPYFDEARKSKKQSDLLTLLKIIERNTLVSIQFLDKPIARLYRRLTSMEIQVADMIKLDKSSKEIADTLNLSLRSVYFHRNNIRRKLGICNRKTNLRSHLISFR